MSDRDKEHQIFGLLGLARRARQVVDGQDKVFAAIANGTAKLVILSEDAGENGRKKVIDKTTFYRVPVRIFGSKAALGAAIGRREVAAVAVLEDGFARKLEERFGEKHGGGAFDESPSL